MDKPLKYISLNYFFILMMLLIAVFIGCDKEVSRSPMEPEAPKGFIYVDSDPEGFTIFFNDRNTGRITPDSISYIDADQYEITLKKKYFKDTSVVVLLDENEKKNIFIDIVSNPSMYGNLVLTTMPAGAAITINDSLINHVTPYTIQDLWPGSYNVKFSLYNHRSVSFSAIVESAKSNSYTEALRDTSIWVDYQVFNSGIQSNSLTDIAVGLNNVKWFGTLEKGLIKFDEINFQGFNTSNSSIPSNRINCVSVDPINRVWVGTDFGIGVFDGSNWTAYNRNNSGLTAEIINDFTFDNNGNTWIATSSNFLKFDGINWFVYEDPNELYWITSIYVESENNIWLGTVADGIINFVNGNHTKLLQTNFGYPSKTISSIHSDSFNNIWFCFLPDTAGRGGISYYDGSAFHNYFPGSPQINVNDVYIDIDNNKWFATSEGFLMYDAQNVSTAFRTYNSLISSNLTISCTRDLNGNVWVTTFSSGLNKYKPPQ